MMKGIRWKDGVDVWTCSCGAVVLMGRRCRCGKMYADILADRHGMESQKDKQKTGRKFRQPSSEGEFTQSYLYKNRED